MTSRPQRKRFAGDRLLGAHITPEELAVDYAIAPFDRAMRQAEARWGIGRLPELVTPETARKWGEVMAALNTAIAANDLDAVTANVTRLCNGLARLEYEAAQAGHVPLPPFLEHRGPARHFIVIHDARDLPLVQAAFPGVTIHTLTEVAASLDDHRDAVVNEARKHFPTAQIVSIHRPGPAADLDDEIPF